MPSEALCLNQTIEAEDKEPTKEDPKMRPQTRACCAFTGPWGRSRGDVRLDSLRPAPGVLSLNLRGSLLSKEPVV